jgi:hypothetical protein
MLSFLLSLLCVVESYTANDKTGDEDFFLAGLNAGPDKMKKAAIKDIATKAGPSKRTVEKI